MNENSNIIGLEKFFYDHPKIALGFSGGVDSSYLLYAGMKYGADIKPYFIKGAFQPEFELNDAVRLAKSLGAEDKLKIIRADILADDIVAENNSRRCYYCKKRVFGAILENARADGYNAVIDGTNASDDLSDRPGAKALKEMKVFSPLRMAGLTKAEIRKLSREAGLFTWNKPSYACLATRIPTGRHITEGLLQRVESAESVLSEMGFRDFRVRVLGDAGKIQLRPEEMLMAVEKRDSIVRELEPYFNEICLDLKGR